MSSSRGTLEESKMRVKGLLSVGQQMEGWRKEVKFDIIEIVSLRELKDNGPIDHANKIYSFIVMDSDQKVA